MTLHLSASNSVAEKILSYLESLKKEGESVEIIDDALYKYEKNGILIGLSQIQKGELFSAQELIEELKK